MFFGGAPRPIQKKPGLPYKFPALKMDGRSFSRVHIAEKADQCFAMYATEWERRFSALLVSPGFTPIVDSYLTVVGYAATEGVRGARIYIGGVKGEAMTFTDGRKQETRMVYQAPREEFEQLVKDQYPMFIDTAPPAGEWYEYVMQRAPYATYTMFCTIDGEAIAVISREDHAGAVSEEPPWEYILMGKALAQLGAQVGSRIVKAVVRRAAQRALLRGATRDLADLAAARSAGKIPAKSRAFIAESGMTQPHFRCFQEAAADDQVIVVVRLTNTKSTPLITKGAPGKPKDLEFLNTSPENGIVYARDLQQTYQTYKKGYAVVGEDGVAKRLVRGEPGAESAVYETVHIPDKFWQIEKGQVLDPKLGRPFVGDYDLMGVIKPSNPGQNIALFASDGEILTDFTNPMVTKFRNTVNTKIGGLNRVLHGAQDQYKGFKGGAVVFHPDRTVELLKDEAAVRAFYESLKRETRAGSYGVHTPPADGKYPALRLVK
jgi:hypothetical protein